MYVIFCVCFQALIIKEIINLEMYSFICKLYFQKESNVFLRFFVSGSNSLSCFFDSSVGSNCLFLELPLEVGTLFVSLVECLPPLLAGLALLVLGGLLVKKVCVFLGLCVVGSVLTMLAMVEWLRHWSMCVLIDP